LQLFILLKMGAGSSVRRPAKAAMAAIAINDETIVNIRKKEEHLQRQIDAEFANAKKFYAAGKKREARQCIQKKKMYEQQLTTLGTSKRNLENQKSTMESLNTTTKINAALRNGKKAMKKQVKTLGGADKVDDLMDGLEEVQTEAQEIDNAMNRQVGLNEADDDENFAEFEELMEEELAADSSKVDLGRAVKKPSAPISLPAAGTKKIMTAEERELAELDAAMAG
jgi:charged multivesicular body protein 4